MLTIVNHLIIMINLQKAKHCSDAIRGLESMLLRGFHALASYVLRDGDQTNDLRRAEAHFNAALHLGWKLSKFEHGGCFLGSWPVGSFGCSLVLDD